MTDMPISGFILAGGRSTRMGRDKASLDWHGRPLLTHMAALLQQATDVVHVVGRDHLPDHFPSRGPLSGIATALTVTTTELNLIIAIDLPLLTKDFLTFLRLETERSKRPLLACKIGSYFPLCLGIRRNLLEEVTCRVSNRNLRVHSLIEETDADIISESHLAERGFDRAMFRNLNTPEDYILMHGNDY